ncbi:MAG: 23S rRNA (adenine(2503)-C(2))-methyltransferase RlmN [Saccharofermentanales bacterium]|jgi:23S rRNA (adenine2503-C2)-methyltransferase|nr:23S rRNA (adenine(2503)-C(2))-methyltransferase RlmN [Bacillota bacterium]
MTNNQKLKKIFYDFDRADFTEFAAKYNWQKFRVNQLLEWQEKSVQSTAEMTNLSKEMRQILEQEMFWPALKIIKIEHSHLEPVNKYLFELQDGNRIETVSMHYDYGHSVCLTTQVGCKMGCDFCASAKLGFIRNLSAGEMLAQITMISREEKSRVSHAVLMGIGEPLDNYLETVKFLRNLRSEDGYSMSMRNITISTCGLVPQIRKLAEENLPITLAISLHAADQAVREKLMLIAKRYPVQEIIEAADYYFAKTGRRVTYEYTLFDKINDQREHAEQLVELLKGKPVHINLIPANEVPGSIWTRSSTIAIQNFLKILQKNKLNATVRYSAGQDITAACGQLRRQTY